MLTFILLVSFVFTASRSILFSTLEVDGDEAIYFKVFFRTQTCIRKHFPKGFLQPAMLSREDTGDNVPFTCHQAPAPFSLQDAQFSSHLDMKLFSTFNFSSKIKRLWRYFETSALWSTCNRGAFSYPFGRHFTIVEKRIFNKRKDSLLDNDSCILGKNRVLLNRSRTLELHVRSRLQGQTCPFSHQESSTQDIFSNIPESLSTNQSLILPSPCTGSQPSLFMIGP